jgi:hypothetical protein
MHCYHNNHAAVTAKALWKADVRANVLAPSCLQVDKAHTQAFASATTKRGHWEATICAALTWYKKSHANFNGLFAAYNASTASQDTATVEAAERAEALAELASTDEQQSHKLAECAALTAEAALAEYDAQKRASQDVATVKAVKCTTALATTASTDDKEAASRMRNATAMTTMVFVMDMRRQVMGGTAQH